MIEAFSLVDVLCNTWIWATWKLVNSASFLIICWQCSLFLDRMPETSSIQRAHVLTKHIFLSFFFFFEFSECYLTLHCFSDVALRFLQIAFCGLFPVEPIFPFDPWIFCLLSLAFPPRFQLYLLLLFRGFLLLYCCSYLLIIGLEPQVWLGVFLSFLRLFCLRFLTWSGISFFFFHNMYMLKSLSIWPSGIFVTFLLYWVLHICFHSVHHFNTVRSHFWFWRDWLLGYFLRNQKSCRGCTGKRRTSEFYP